jgi:Type II secretory pathway, ATPase PulE/Tfp pilus assembly pathway, ATPase PilB
MITRIKVVAGMDISEKRLPQDGKFQHCCKDSILDLRVSSLPTIYGEKLVLRILDRKMEYCNIEKLYESIEQRKLIKKILLRSSGIILATGPTGSGKSTTLYAMLNELNRKSVNITSIEDPVEYTISGINQINVNTKSGISFAVGLRSILRQDPDVIMIGEIRDEETAAIAIRAAITGHLVLSTLHTNDAVGTINRLAEMGIERYLLADALIAVISQRLVSKICCSCRIEYTPSKTEEKLLKIHGGSKVYRGKGCSKCNYNGYKGRIMVSEILTIDEKLRKAISKGSDFIIESKSLVSQCREMVLRGITTTEELIRISNGTVLEAGDFHEEFSISFDR